MRGREGESAHLEPHANFMLCRVRPIAAMQRISAHRQAEVPADGSHGGIIGVRRAEQLAPSQDHSWSLNNMKKRAHVLRGLCIMHSTLLRATHCMHLPRTP
jgi:hypothetical protein